MPAEAFIITELTGPRREVRLFDRALPYQGVAWGTESRHVKREYPGSRVATIQVMGASLLDTDLEGMWKTRFLAAKHSVELVGFGDVSNEGGRVTAEDLVEVMQRLVESSQNLEVRWGPHVRRGILASFQPTYDRVEDIAWRMTFVWSQRDTSAPRRAAVALDTTSAMQRALDDLDLSMAEIPESVLPSVADDLEAKAAAARAAGAAFTETLGRIQSTTNATISDIQTAQTLADRLVQAIEAVRSGTMSDLPYYNLTPIDDVGALLEIEVWRRDTSAAARSAQAQARRSSTAASERSAPGAMEVVTLTENTSLRALAVKYYADADAWTAIADANGLVSAVAAAGLRLVIPRPSGQGVTTR